VLVLLAFVVLASAAVRLADLDRFTGLVFDEHYYVHDARVILAGDVGRSGPSPWLPGAEWGHAHPDLGKLVIAAGIRLFGDTPWGWRLPGALAGIATVALVYPLARRLGLPPTASLAATVLAASDTLAMAMSRVATLDAQVSLWTALAVLAALLHVQAGRRAWLVLLGVAGGLATATKWSGMLAVLAALLILAVGPRLWPRPGQPSPRGTLARAGVVAALATLVYVATYAQYFLAGHGVGDFLRLQEHMAAFGWGVKGSLTFASRPATWLFDVQPIWFRWFLNERGTVGLLAIGNPVLFWAATAALVVLAVRAVRTRDAAGDLALLVVAALYLPWLLTTRQTYLYYILPAVPFLAIALAAALAPALDGTGLDAPERRRLPACGWALGAAAGAAAWPLLSALHAVAASRGATVAAAASLLLAAVIAGWRCRAGCRPQPQRGRAAAFLAWGLIGLASGVALALLPFVLGLPVPYSYYDRLMLFTTWR